LIVAKIVKVSNGLLINLAYNDIDMSSIYAIYNPNTDKLSSSATADLLKTSSTFSELLRPTFVFKLMYAEDNEKIVSESEFGLLIFFINFLKKTQTSN
jgi:hypothetical protein